MSLAITSNPFPHFASHGSPEARGDAYRAQGMWEQAIQSYLEGANYPVGAGLCLKLE